ncbi:putative leader peptide [Streptomyces erythrochromogenes]|uniref:putative leader peptide n=1 Tax=Streptomyces erythrochromogenes TaxID=285574 RepID=UPI003682AA16
MRGAVCQYAYQPGRKTRDSGGEVTVRTPHHAGLLLPRLTTRRHIDLVRTSSAICQPV